jgi:mannose-6-phosphate isomerase-like protein (cupin superfamily)
MKVTRYLEAEKVALEHDGRKMCVRPDLEMIHLCLKPGETIPLHNAQFDLVANVIHGEGMADSGDIRSNIFKFDCVEIPKNKPRSFVNTGNEELRLLILKIH